MKRFLVIAGLLGSLLAASAAIAHTPPSPEPQRACKAYRPNGAVPNNSPVEASKDRNGDNYTGVCTAYGVARVGTTPDGAWVAADGSRAMASIAPSPAPEEASWGQGYVLLTVDPDGVRGFCAGAGQYEEGAQDDDEFMTGDCGGQFAPSPEPEPSESPTPDPTPSESPTPDPTDSPTPEPTP